MTENEFLLQDRLAKIKSTIEKYGEENFYLSFSGGKDSTVLSALLDMACPGNKIPRVYANTGIEYRMIFDFVEKMKEKDHPWELVVLEPTKNIRQMLEEEGYPFKSKEHSAVVASYQNGNKNGLWVKHYLEKTGRFKMPDCLRYQFTDMNNLKISDKCCYRLKEEPLHKYQKDFHKPYGIVGIMREEGGRRNRASCLAFQGNKLKNFQPLALVTKDWEDWFIEKYDVTISDIYKEPYNFERTGCKGCPFNPKLQNALDMLEKFFPGERKQCELIWKPVYDEYRRLGYRLRKNGEYKQITFKEVQDADSN